MVTIHNCVTLDGTNKANIYAGFQDEWAYSKLQWLPDAASRLFLNSFIANRLLTNPQKYPGILPERAEFYGNQNVINIALIRGTQDYGDQRLIAMMNLIYQGFPLVLSKPNICIADVCRDTQYSSQGVARQMLSTVLNPENLSSILSMLDASVQSQQKIIWMDSSNHGLLNTFLNSLDISIIGDTRQAEYDNNRASIFTSNELPRLHQYFEKNMIWRVKKFLKLYPHYQAIEEKANLSHINTTDRFSLITAPNPFGHFLGYPRIFRYLETRGTNTSNGLIATQALRVIRDMTDPKVNIFLQTLRELGIPYTMIVNGASIGSEQINNDSLPPPYIRLLASLSM